MLFYLLQAKEYSQGQKHLPLILSVRDIYILLSRTVQVQKIGLWDLSLAEKKVHLRTTQGRKNPNLISGFT